MLPRTSAQPPLITPKIIFKQNGQLISGNPQTLDVTVGSTFTVDVYVSNILTGYDMWGYYIQFTWDSAMVEPTYVTVLPTMSPPWTQESGYDTSPGYFWARTVMYNPITPNLLGEVQVAIITFQSLAGGQTTVTFSAPAVGSIDLNPTGSNSGWSYLVGDTYLILNQIGDNAVGGNVFTPNKLAVLSPYLALLTVVAVAAVLVKRRKL